MANVHKLLKDLMEEIGPEEQDVPTIGKLYKKWMNEAQRFRSMKSINAYKMTLTYIKASKPKGQHHKRKCNISNCDSHNFGGGLSAKYSKKPLRALKLNPPVKLRLIFKMCISPLSILK